MSDLPDWTKLTPREKADAILPYLAAGESNGKIASLFLNCGRCQIAGAVNRMKIAGLNPPARGVPTGSSRKANAPRAPKSSSGQKPKHRKPSPRMAIVPGGAPKINQYDFAARAEQRAASPGLPEHLVTGTAAVSIPGTAVPQPKGLSITELTDRTCRWPTGDPQASDFGFCGHETSHHPYCTYHARLAFVPASERQRAGLRSAERIR